MPSFNIHLAIGKLYSKRNTINDLESFYIGIIAPDLVEDKTRSHYTGNGNKEDLLSYLKTKVQLSLFLKENKIESDYMKGVFFHLVTDYLFFNYFFDNEYINTLFYDDFIKNLYYSYDCANTHLRSKYGIDPSMFKSETYIKIMKVKTERKVLTNEIGVVNILDQGKLDEFIEMVSNINVDDYCKKIMEHSGNYK